MEFKKKNECIKYCIDNNSELHYHKRQHIYSSTEIRERTARMENEKNKEFTLFTKQYDPELIK